MLGTHGMVGTFSIEQVVHCWIWLTVGNASKKAEYSYCNGIAHMYGLHGKIYLSCHFTHYS
jgi:hypothetical protein